MLDPDLVPRCRKFLDYFGHGRNALFTRALLLYNGDHDAHCFVCNGRGAHNSHRVCLAFSILNNLFTPWVLCNISY